MPDREARSAAVIDRLREDGGVALSPLRSDGFADLSRADKLLAYHLSQAAAAGQPILYAQRSQHLPLLLPFLEELVRFLPARMPLSERRLYADYLKRLRVHGGYHDSDTLRKFLPGFTPAQLGAAAQVARRLGARFPGVVTAAGLSALLQRLHRPLFDPTYQPMAVARTPGPGQDLLSASAATYYSGLGLRDLARLSREAYPLNSTVTPARERHKPLQELVWRAGTTDGRVPAGGYGTELGQVAAHLEDALSTPGIGARPALRELTGFLRTGDPLAFRRYTLSWQREDAAVGALLGFVDTARDPRQKKGEYLGLVYHTDLAGAAEAQKLEALLPTYAAALLGVLSRRLLPPPRVSPVVVLAMAGGAGPLLPPVMSLPAGGAGGRRVLVLTNALSAVEQAVLPGEARALSCDRAEALAALEHGPTARRVFTLLRELVGGPAAEGLTEQLADRRAAERLREYRAPIAAAEVDLAALYAGLDPQTQRLLPGPAQGELVRGYLRQALRGLLMAQPDTLDTPDTLDRPADQARQLVVQHLLRRARAVTLQGPLGRRAYCVADVPALRRAIGELLGELWRIQRSGDYAAARALVETYGRLVDPGLRREVWLRTRAAQVPARVGLVAPRLWPIRDAGGAIVDVRLEPVRDPLRGWLRQ